jgi:hypothetical protein
LATALALLPSPLLGVHGVESALALGIVLPPFVAVAAARQVARVRQRGVAITASSLVGRSLGMAAGVLALPVAVLALNALRVRNCAPGQGLLYMLLGPLPSVLLAATVGVTLGAALRRDRLAALLAAGAPILGAAVVLSRFYATPAVALYGHFFGWYPGAIYDQALTVPLELATFRGVTVLWIAGLGWLVVGLYCPGTRRFRLRSARPVPSLAGLGLLGAAAVAAAFGPELGHRVTEAHVVEELGITERGARCIVHAPRELPRRELSWHVADCDFRVHQAEQLLGVQQHAPVRVYLFRTTDEKRRLMGAATTNIAKPWRNEVYLHLRPWPHPVLGHEVAHVVAGQVGAGPFRVAGRLGGLVPNPGLVEGMAVALAWEPRDGLTPHQWARAMREVDRMPSLRGIMGLSFLLQPGSNAYTAAGSFLRFVLETRGSQVLRDAYRTGDVARAAGVPLADLEQQWLAHLEQVPLPEGALELARVRFEGGSLFSTVCPRQVAVLHRRLRGDLGAGDAERLLLTCEELLTIDHTDHRARAELAGALARSGREDEARSQVALLAGRYDAPAPLVAAARERLGDAAWQHGDVAVARRRYRALLDEPQGPDEARVLEVKALAVDAPPEEARVLFELLVGEDARGAPPAMAVHLARELSALRDDGLGPYLEGRQLFLLQRHHHAALVLEKAVALGLPTARLEHEALRMVGASFYAAGLLAEAERLWLTRRQGAAALADRIEAEEWLGRIRFARHTAPTSSAR